MTKLSNATLPSLRPGIQTPRYARDAVTVGIVHFGPGNFHRAHQAAYIDDILATDPSWGIVGVSLRSDDIAQALMPQDSLYTLAIADAAPSHRILGAHRAIISAQATPESVRAYLVAPTTRMVTITISEKGYCLTPAGDLDTAHPVIQHDLAHPHAPQGLIGWLVEGLRLRRANGTKPYTVISCDNLADNGTRLGRAVTQYAGLLDADLGRWIADAVCFPRTMVDSITPSTDAALHEQVAAATGLTDAWPVRREAFTQWVIEDSFCNDTPDWASVGVMLTNDVGAHERAKLRLLNGTHSTLAYLGLLAGHVTVADAMNDQRIAAFVEKLARDDIQPSVTPPPGVNLSAYITSIFARYRNPAIGYPLAQIAGDGSQKLPFRLLETIGNALAADRSVTDLCMPIAAWMCFAVRETSRGAALSDPLASQIADIARRCTGNAAADVARFLTLEMMFPRGLAQNASFLAATQAAYEALSP